MAAESKDDAAVAVAAYEEEEEVTSSVAKCNTCMACFSNTDKVKEHYRSDWHAYNSKRRAAGLPPVRKNDFKELLIRSGGTGNSSKKSTKSGAKQTSTGGSSGSSSISNCLGGSVTAIVHSRNEPAAAVDKIPSKRQQRTLEKHGGKEHTRAQKAVAAIRSAKPATKILSNTAEVNEEEEDEEIELVDTFDDEEALPVGPHICIFDNREFASTQQCAEYMSKKYGFFIPDAEYLIDRDGLLQYLGEKVKLGGYCLYCQKRLLPGRPVQSHMISKSHCKIRYEEGVDVEEYEDFYDFSAMYEKDGGGCELDENGEVVEPAAEVTDVGELLLSNGRLLGHRSHRRFHKQKH